MFTGGRHSSAVESVLPVFRAGGEAEGKEVILEGILGIRILKELVVGEPAGGDIVLLAVERRIVIIRRLRAEFLGMEAVLDCLVLLKLAAVTEFLNAIVGIVFISHHRVRTIILIVRVVEIDTVAWIAWQNLAVFDKRDVWLVGIAVKL